MLAILLQLKSCQRRLLLSVVMQLQVTISRKVQHRHTNGQTNKFSISEQYLHYPRKQVINSVTILWCILWQPPFYFKMELFIFIYSFNYTVLLLIFVNRVLNKFLFCQVFFYCPLYHHKGFKYCVVLRFSVLK